MLEIAKYPAYLSPSSLAAYEKQPNKFYLQRMAPNPWPFDEQGIAAAVGSAFDARVKKNYLTKPDEVERVRQLVIKDCYVQDAATKYADMNFYETLCRINIDAKHFEEAAGMGLMLWQSAGKTPFAKREIEKVEVHYNFTLYGVINVPLFMKLDAAVKQEGAPLAPLDWKVMGYNSQASPKPGYKEMYDGMAVVDRHKNWRNDICFSEIDMGWATQLCTYGWGLGNPLGKKFKAYIDAVVIRKTGTRFVHYDGWISERCQMEVAERYRKAWREIKSGEFLNNLPSERAFVEMNARGERWW